MKAFQWENNNGMKVGVRYCPVQKVGVQLPLVSPKMTPMTVNICYFLYLDIIVYSWFGKWDGTLAVFCLQMLNSVLLSKKWVHVFSYSKHLSLFRMSVQVLPDEPRWIRVLRCWWNTHVASLGWRTHRWGGKLFRKMALPLITGVVSLSKQCTDREYLQATQYHVFSRNVSESQSRISCSIFLFRFVGCSLFPLMKISLQLDTLFPAGIVCSLKVCWLN